jgi:hypothetical protein
LNLAPKIGSPIEKAGLKISIFKFKHFSDKIYYVCTRKTVPEPFWNSGLKGNPV